MIDASKNVKPKTRCFAPSTRIIEGFARKMARGFSVAELFFT
jgi:hypothetical protein